MPDPSPVPDCRILGGLREVSPSYDVLLCDVWGVVHNGRTAFADSAYALSRFRAAGGTVILLTNAPRPNGPVRRQLDHLGVPQSAYDAVVTSGDATVALIADRGDVPLYHIGPPRDLALLEEVRRAAGFEPRLTTIEAAAYALCTGLFDDATETPDAYADMFQALRARGLDMICANPDRVVHIGDRLIYCGGALGEAYAAQGGTVLLAGKPHAPIYRVALATAARLRGAPVPTGRVLAIGDGMGTDIAGAATQGLDSLFVTDGIHRDETGAERGLEPGALAAFLSRQAATPRAAIHRLVW